MTFVTCELYNNITEGKTAVHQKVSSVSDKIFYSCTTYNREETSPVNPHLTCSGHEKDSPSPLTQGSRGSLSTEPKVLVLLSRTGNPSYHSKVLL